MGLLQKKKQTGGETGVEDMEYPGGQINSTCNFWGSIKNEVEFPRVTKKKWPSAIALSYPPRVRVRATVQLSATFFHDESSITIGGVRKCNSALRKNNVEFSGVLVFGLGISKGSNKILWNFQEWALFCLELAQCSGKIKT